MLEMLPITPSIDQLSRIIGNVAAPAFLLGAVASFISVLSSRINRVVDRAQFLHGIGDGDSTRLYLKSDIPHLRLRAKLLNRSLFCSIVAAILTSLIIIVAFISAMFGVAHEYGVALLFIGALVLFCVSLIDFAREASFALRDNDFRS
jgi:prepilin signal peptidase PulO-like enzyme (type II secretory pathway)